MNVRVLFFSYAADRMNGRVKQFEIPPGESLGAFFAQQLEPQLQEPMERFRFSVNQEWAQAQDILHEGDEVVVIPPVSGG